MQARHRWSNAPAVAGTVIWLAVARRRRERIPPFQSSCGSGGKGVVRANHVGGRQCVVFVRSGGRRVQGSVESARGHHACRKAGQAARGGFVETERGKAADAAQDERQAGRREGHVEAGSGPRIGAIGAIGAFKDNPPATAATSESRVERQSRQGRRAAVRARQCEICCETWPCVAAYPGLIRRGSVCIVRRPALLRYGAPSPVVTIRNVSSDRWSRTRECNVTRDFGSGGKPSRAPTSTSSRGATRRASGATAMPAAAAAPTAVTLPPTKASRQGLSASSSARSATARTLHGPDSNASGSASPARAASAARPASSAVR